MLGLIYLYFVFVFLEKKLIMKLVRTRDEHACVCAHHLFILSLFLSKNLRASGDFHDFILFIF